MSNPRVPPAVWTAAAALVAAALLALLVTTLVTSPGDPAPREPDERPQPVGADPAGSDRGSVARPAPGANEPPAPPPDPFEHGEGPGAAAPMASGSIGGDSEPQPSIVRPLVPLWTTLLPIAAALAVLGGVSGLALLLLRRRERHDH